MKYRNILKHFGLSTLWLSLGALSTAVLLSIIDITPSTPAFYSEMAGGVEADRSGPSWDSPNRDVPGSTERAPNLAYRGWEGDFHYKLEHHDGFYHGAIEFLKLKGLRGETIEDIEIKGHIVFTPARGNVLYAGEGAVNYSIARMSLSAMGDAMVVHFLDGNGVDEVKKNLRGTYLRMNRASGTYSFRIEPGSYETDIDAFGVKVLGTTEMKITQAFIEKMESEDRPVMYPGALKEMFPEYDWYPDRDHVVLEAFDMPLQSSGNSVSGSYTDEKGGVLSWKFVAF